MLSSCSVAGTDKSTVNIKPVDEDTLIYDGYEYNYWGATNDFSPFLDNFNGVARNEKLLCEKFFIDAKDKKITFIYEDLGILGLRAYKRADIEIPKTLTDLDKIDEIQFLGLSEEKFHTIDDKNNIKTLLSYFNSDEYNSYIMLATDSSKDCRVYIVSSYYGVVYRLANTEVVENNGKYYLSTTKGLVEMPDNVQTAIKQATVQNFEEDE